MSAGHSSTVSIRLHVNDCVLGVAQVGEHSLILRHSFECPPRSTGRIEIVVDGHHTVYDVLFHEGIARDAREIGFRDITPSLHCDTERPLFESNDVPF